MAVIRPLVRLLLTALAPAALGLGLLLVVLPRPTADARLATRILARLEQTPFRGAVVRLSGQPLRASCRRLSRRSYLVSLDDGQRLIVDGAHVTATRVRSVAARQLASASVRTPAQLQLAAAEADLAGPRSLYVDELVGRLLSGGRVVAGRARFHGVPAYRVRLGGDRPSVVLYVDAATLRPLGVRFASRALQGSSRLLDAPRRGC